MHLDIRRIMIFAKDPTALAAFYARAFGLQVVGQEPGFVDLAAGPVRLAFHETKKANAGHNKICFFAEDVDAAVRNLALRGARMGKPRGNAALRFCDGTDPEGNTFQISNRP